MKKLIAALFLFLTPSVFAGTVLESFTAGNDSGTGGGHGLLVGRYDGSGDLSDREMAQSFTLDTAIECDQVQLEFSENINTMNGTTTLTVETSSGGSPSGSLVDADLTDGIADQPAAGYRGDAFGGTGTLSSGTLYWIHAASSNTTGSAYERLMSEDDSDAYTDGSAKYRDNNGAGSWTAINYDANFKVYGTVISTATNDPGVSGPNTGPMMIFRFDSKTGKEQIVAYYGTKKTAKEAFDELEAQGKI